MRWHVYWIVTLSISSLAPPVFAAPPTVELPVPPVDCRNATETVDRVICSEDWLAARDAQIADLFYDVYRQLDGTQQAKLLEEQKTWLRNRIAFCPVPVGPNSSSELLSAAEKCLDQAYTARMRALDREIPDFQPVKREPKSRSVLVVNAPFIGKTSLAEGIVSAKDIDAAMDIPLSLNATLVPPGSSPFDDSRGVKVTSCRQWLDLTDKGWKAAAGPPHGDPPMIAASCGILRELALAKPAEVSYLPANGIGDFRLYSTRIMGCTLMWECEALDDLVECGATVAAFEEKGCNNNEMVVDKETGVAGAIVVGWPHRPYDLVFAENDRFGKSVWFTSITVIARADFTDDGIEDFLIEFSRIPDTSDGSSGTGLTTIDWMILTRRPGENAIEPIVCGNTLAFCRSYEKPVRSPADHPANRLP